MFKVIDMENFKSSHAKSCLIRQQILGLFSHEGWSPPMVLVECGMLGHNIRSNCSVGVILSPAEQDTFT